MTTFRFDDDPDNHDDGPDYFLRNPERERQTVSSGGNVCGNQSSDSIRQQHHGRWRRRLLTVIIFAVAIVGAAGYVRYFVPHTSSSRLRGEVSAIERRGIFFRVFEASLTATGGETFSVSVPDDSIASLMESAMTDGRPVTLTVEKYYAPALWRGESNIIVTDIR